MQEEPNPPPVVPREGVILFLVAAVQFINICDFMILAPLGPQLAVAIDIPESSLPDATAAYTFAAGVAGLVGSVILDRFDRKRAFIFCMLGLVLGTAAGGFATGLGSLVAARMLAGMFGGPASAIALAIVADVVPEARRGRAMGAIMGAFAAASVLGVPLAIALSEVGTWRTPLYGIAAAGLILIAAAAVLMPPLRGHLDRPKATHDTIIPWEMLRRPTVIASYAMTATASIGMFALMPNIATYLQNNMGLPLGQLKYMYLAGGIVSFFTTRLAGRLVDRFGSLRVATVGTVASCILIYVGFATETGLPWREHLIASSLGIFAGFMFSNGIRNVAYSTLTSKVPRPFERARFMSLQSSTQHLSSAAGAALSARLLTVGSDHRLIGFGRVAAVGILFTMTLPFAMRLVERRLAQGA